MTRSFADKRTAAVWDDRMLASARRLEDLRVPPANRLEALLGNRTGQRSIRVNDQWRLCFVWRDGDALDVAIVD